MKLFKTILFSLFTIFIGFQSQAQRAKDGNATISTLNNVVNTYTSLTANASIGGTTINVASSAMSGASFSGNLAPGDLILIIQMQGASMNHDAAFCSYSVPAGFTWNGNWFDHAEMWGSIGTDFGANGYGSYNNAGKFERAEVRAVPNGTSIQLQCGLKNNYTASGHVQIVRIPRYDNLTVNAGSSIVPTAWNGTTGGIVALEVDGALTVNAGGLIHANGFGFRGGALDLTGKVGSATPPVSVRFLGSSDPAEGSEKGEGIFGFTAEYTPICSRYGIGAATNGGGGGGYQNAGGGGGANVSASALRYTGTGTPDQNGGAYTAAWNLDISWPPNPNTDIAWPPSHHIPFLPIGTNTSPGGGRGGYGLAQTDRDEMTMGPDNSSWGGDSRKTNGGLGGHPLAYDPTRLYFGGGGGAGDQDGAQGGAGGAGGGLVFILSYGTMTGSGTISANGAAGQKTNPFNQNPSGSGANQRKGNDGAGGGGAGGAIFVENATAIPASLSFTAIGGNGGNQDMRLYNNPPFWVTLDEASGPGGSGAGGSIAFSSGAPTQNVNAGVNGVVVSQSYNGSSYSPTSPSMVGNFPPNGATNGSVGMSGLSAPYYDLQISDVTTCTTPVTLTVTVLGTIPSGGTIGWYTQQFGGSTFATGTSTSVSPASTTTYYVGVCPGSFRVPVTVTITATAPTPTITAGGPTTFCTGGSVTLTSSAATGNQWYLNGTAIGGATSQTYAASAAGNYTVIVTSGGCTSSPSLATTVTVNPTPATPTIAASGPTTFCTGGSVTLTSSAASGNQWSLNGTPIGGATAQTYLATTAGNYTVVTTSGGCPSAASAATTVTINPTPATPTIAAGGPTTFCSGGSVTLTSSSASGNQWSLNGTPIGGATAQTYSANASGDYTVIVTTAGCPSAASAATTVTVNPTPATPTIVAGGPTTFCSGGSVNLTSSSASGNQWSLNGTPIGGATNQNYLATTAGNYTVVVTTAGCPSAASAATTVTVTPNPVITLGTVTDPSACATATGSIQVNGTATGVVSWTGAAVGNSGSVTLPYVITGLAAGTYNIIITVGSCPSNTLVQGLTDPSAPATPTIAASGATTFCAGGSVTLTSSSATGNQWSLNGTPIGGATAQTLLVNASGNYTVVVTSGGCTSSASAATTVTVNPIPATPTIAASGPTTFCSGGSVTLTSSSATGNQWSLNGTPIGGATAQTLLVSASGDYTVIVTTSGCSSAASAPTTVTVNPTPATPTIAASGPTTFCTGGSVTLTSSSATGNQWSLNGTPIGGATAQTLLVSASGNYTVIVTAAGCPSAASAATTVTVNPIPATPTIAASGPTTFCSGGSVTLTSSSATGNQWSLNGMPIGGATAQTLLVSASGDYTVIVTTSGCSSTASAPTTVTVNPTPATPTIAASGPTTFCTGGSVTLTSSSATGNQWSLNGTPIGGATAQTLLVSASGNYTVIVTAAGCPSAASAATTVTVNPTPATPTIAASGPTTFCSGGSVTLTSSSATGNQWSLNGTPIGGATNQTLLVSASGDYTVIVTTGGCTSAASVPTTVTVNPTPATPTIAAGGPTTFCAGGSVTLTSSSATGNQWYLDGAPIGGATAQTHLASVSGDYTVVVTSGGCPSAPSTATTVIVIPNPVITVGTVTNPSSCGTATGSIQVNGTATGVVSWTGTAVGNSGTVTLPYVITGLAAGTYNIIITVGPCTSNTLVQGLSDPSAPATPTITAGGPTTFCGPGSVTLTSSSATGNQWSLNGTPIGGATSQMYSATTSGDYTVVVTSGGCSSAASAVTTVTVNATPAVTVSNSGPICIGGSFSLNETGGDAVSWMWSTSGGATITTNTDQSPTVTSAVDGEVFTVVVTSANTCANTANTTVSVIQSPVLDPIADVVNCGPYTLPAITGTNLTGSEAYYDNAIASGGTQILGPISSTQTVWVYDGIATCEDEINFQVTIKPLPTVVSFTGGANYCDGDVVSDVMVDVSGSADWSLNYTLNGTAQNIVSSTTPFSLGNAEGVYVLTSVSDLNCTNTASQTQTIVVTMTPSQPVASSDVLYCADETPSSISVSGNGGTYTWYTDNTLSSFYGTGSFVTPLTTSQVYYVTESLNGCESTPDDVVVTFENCEVIYPTAFTPDGDGTNDTWEILGLDEKYPNNTVRIYNRWGNLIFEHESSVTNPYNNNRWDGTYKGAPLPVGSFYYIIDVSGSDEKIKGTVSIILN